MSAHSNLMKEKSSLGRAEAPSAHIGVSIFAHRIIIIIRNTMRRREPACAAVGRGLAKRNAIIWRCHHLYCSHYIACSVCAAIHLNIYLAPLIDCRKKRRRRVKGVMHMCENNKRRSSAPAAAKGLYRRRRSCIAHSAFFWVRSLRWQWEWNLRCRKRHQFREPPANIYFWPLWRQHSRDALRGFLEKIIHSPHLYYAKSAQLLMNKAKVDNPKTKKTCAVPHII